MAYGFSKPDIHFVQDVRAVLQVVTNRSGGEPPFACLHLQIVGPENESAEVDLYFPAGFIGRACEIADAINDAGAVKQAAE